MLKIMFQLHLVAFVWALLHKVKACTFQACYQSSMNFSHKRYLRPSFTSQCLTQINIRPLLEQGSSPSEGIYIDF